MKKLEGSPISNKILADLKKKISKIKATPGLAVILVGNDEASKIYVDLKKRRAEEIGIRFSLYEFTEDSSQEDVIFKINELNSKEDIDGIIVQLPLPDNFNTDDVINSIKLSKDVDGFSVAKDSFLEPVFPKAILNMIKSSGIDYSGKKALVVVKSEKFGLVMTEVLNRSGIHSSYLLGVDFEKNIFKIKEADIVVSAIGRPGFLKGENFKEGAIVIDGGIAKIDGEIFGDVDLDSIKDKNIFLSPVPKGVGPVTIACLLENVYLAYLNKSNK